MPKLILEDVHLVSPWAPSGVAWLLNALLELGAPIFRDRWNPTWIPDGARWRLTPGEEELKRHLPSLSRAETIEFRTDRRVRWSHEWPMGFNQTKPVILCVRDGGDALNSLFRRFPAGLDLPAFLRAPGQALFGAPAFAPRLSPQDLWALFTLTWLRSSNERLLVVRLEDLKSNPVQALRPVADFLGLSATDTQLADAAELSSFDKAKEAEQRFIHARPELDRFRANRSGVAGESRRIFTPDDWSTFAGLPQYAQAALGFTELPVLDAGAPALEAPEVDAALAMAKEHPSASPRDIARSLAASASEHPWRQNDRFTLGLALLACRWADQLVDAAHEPQRRRLLLTLLKLVPHMGRTPLLEAEVDAQLQTERV